MEEVRTKKCSACHSEKEASTLFFHKRKDGMYGLSSVCKICTGTKIPRTNIHIKEGLLLCLKCRGYKDESEFGVDSQKVYRKCRDSRCKSCKKKQTEKRRCTSRGFGLDRILTERFCSVRGRVLKNKLELDFDKIYLKQLWEEQRGICAISGIEMTYIVFSGRVPTNLSVDRIDSSKGYVKGNVQLVCMAVNQMKSDLEYDELLTFCKAIVENLNAKKFKH